MNGAIRAKTSTQFLPRFVQLYKLMSVCCLSPEIVIHAPSFYRAVWRFCQDPAAESQLDDSKTHKTRDRKSDESEGAQKETEGLSKHDRQTETCLTLVSRHHNDGHLCQQHLLL